MTRFDAAKYKESEKLAYTLGAESYAKIGGPIFEALALPLLDGASLHQGLKVLDIGCGPGIPSLRAEVIVRASKQR